MIKIVKINQSKLKDIDELKDILDKESFKSFAFVGLKNDGNIINFASETSTLELCGMLSYLEQHIKSQIEL